MSSKPAPLKLATPIAAARLPFAPLTLAAGERLLRTGGLQALRAALQPLLAEPLGSVLDALPDTDGWTVFWLAFAWQFDDWMLAGRGWLEAERRFAACSDARGLELANCGLVQCAHFDQQAIEGFEQRAQRTLDVAVDADDSGALALFCTTSRMVAGIYGLDPRGADSAHLSDAFERVFIGLSSELDAELRLRAATAALRGIGRSFDRLRAEDFHQAGAALAASAQVGLYSRLQWHLWIMFARSPDPAAATRLIAEFEAVAPAEPRGPCRTMVARTRMYCARIELARHDLAATRRHLDDAHRLLDPAYPNDYALFHSTSSRCALIQADYQAASAHAAMCLRKLEEGAAVPAAFAVALNDDAMAQAALGRLNEAAALFARSAALDTGEQVSFDRCHQHLARALQLLRDGAHDEGRAELHAGFAVARSIDLQQFFRSVPTVAAEICGAAIDFDADTAFVGKVIAARKLACPDIGIACWPWPLRVRSLGGFAIERDGEPFKFGRKAPRRLLDVLRLVVALGGRQVDSGRVASTLWPDADGDEGRSALKAMLHRARSLLGIDLLVVREGQISFDPATVWLDTWAFEHVSGRIESQLAGGAAIEHADDGELARRRVQLMALYRGNLFGEGDVPAWALPARDRLRARFVRAIDLLGQRLERRGRQDEAIALYRAALEQDNLAEEIYQRLIECHLARGEQAQALNAYRRCRELLSVVLGLKPSARTESLVARIAGR